MTFSKWPTLCLLALAATAACSGRVCSAQAKFPLRPGEWTSTTASPMNPNGPPITMLFCMNDDTWTKALSKPTCALKQLNLTSAGGTYSIDCSTPSMQMKGNFKIVFDGMTHMTSTGSMDIAFNGNTMHHDATSDFKWKGPVCDPNADVNLRDHSKPPSR